MTPKKIQSLAKANAAQRLKLIEAVQDLVRGNRSLGTKISKFDKTFMFKIWAFPGDLSSHRIAKVMEKLLTK